MFRNGVPRVESDDDLAHGQSVIIAARWILVVAGLVLAIWNPGGLVELQVAIVVILGLALGNFALHTQVLGKGPSMARVVYAASVADLAAISLLIISGGGFPAAPYVFYLPALLAISVTFRTEVMALYTAAALGAYGLIAVVTASGGDLLTVLIELLVLAAVPVCGNVYWRLERDRRSRAGQQTEVDPLTSQAAEGSWPRPA